MVKREEIRWIPKTPDCTNNWGFITVDMDVIKPAVTFLLIGYVLAILCVMAEWTYVRFVKHRFQNLLENNLIAINALNL